MKIELALLILNSPVVELDCKIQRIVLGQSIIGHWSNRNAIIFYRILIYAKITYVIWAPWEIVHRLTESLDKHEFEPCRVLRGTLGAISGTNHTFWQILWFHQKLAQKELLHAVGVNPLVAFMYLSHLLEVAVDTIWLLVIGPHTVKPDVNG